LRPFDHPEYLKQCMKSTWSARAIGGGSTAKSKRSILCSTAEEDFIDLMRPGGWAANAPWLQQCRPAICRSTKRIRFVQPIPAITVWCADPTSDPALYEKSPRASPVGASPVGCDRAALRLGWTPTEVVWTAKLSCNHGVQLRSRIDADVEVGRIPAGHRVEFLRAGRQCDDAVNPRLEYHAVAGF
jgi:hypothetical protein